MQFFLKVLLTLLNIPLQEVLTSCGPEDQCICSPSSDRRCSGLSGNLSSICQSVGNRSQLLVEGNNFQNITSDDLDGCQTLEWLSLRGNYIHLSGNCTFCALKKLEYLDLSNNEITFFHKSASNTRQFPLSLKVLRLSNNSLQSDLFYPDFSYLKSLNELFLDGLPDKIFPDSYKEMVQLQTLVMSGLLGKCNVTQITNETLKNLVNIKTLNLSACSIENIYAGAFEKMHNLENLDVSNNERLGLVMLENITYGLQYTRIQSLNVSKLSKTFGPSTQVRLREICYLWNTSVSELVMSSNRIELFETNTAILLSKTLKTLRLDDNRFTFGPYLLQLGCLSKVEHYYGSFQNIYHDPSIFFKELNKTTQTKPDPVNNTNCPYMKSDFLQSISNNLTYCVFFGSDQSMKQYPYFPEALKSLDFASGNMEYNVTAFLYIPLANKVESIDFSGNFLHAITGPIGPFPNLRRVDFSRNYCSFLGLKLSSGLKHVEHFQLSQNLIGRIFKDPSYGPRIFNGFVHLKVLNLSANIITDVPPDALSDLAALETLDLSSNNIEKWTIDVKNLHNLSCLYLRENFLQRLPWTLRKKLQDNSKRLGKPFEIDMSENVIQVSCENKKFLQWMLEHKKNFIQFDKYSFKDSAGSTIEAIDFQVSVKNLERKCASYTLEIVLGTIGVSAFVAVVLGGFIYKHRWNIRYLLRVTNIQIFGHQRINDENETNHFAYDAFVSFANENELFVIQELVQYLESQGFKLHIHNRDFVPGTYIADNIVKAVQRSRKTIAVLSKEYLQSNWCLYEFNMARMESIYSRAGSNCLIVVLYKAVQHKHLKTEMLQWIRTNTYLEYTVDETGEQLFWESLLDALRD